MDPILVSFNAILENQENPIINGISINKLVNDILLLILYELDKTSDSIKGDWLFQKVGRELKILPFSFVSKKEK